MLNDPRDRDNLSPATVEELITSLALALRHDGRWRARDADAFMARVAAERLVKHLRMSGYVVMKKPPAPLPGSRGAVSPSTRTGP